MTVNGYVVYIIEGDGIIDATFIITPHNTDEQDIEAVRKLVSMAMAQGKAIKITPCSAQYEAPLPEALYCGNPLMFLPETHYIYLSYR